mgnify:CR=1 FL=1
MATTPVGVGNLALNLGVEFRLMVEVVGECGVDLSQRQIWMLQMNLCRAEPGSDVIQYDFNNLDLRAGNPGPTVIIKINIVLSD